tara:strand:- start:6621 stop:8363 length:1743 start_codon:yes stop_codon:yes gene_type:complete
MIPQNFIDELLTRVDIVDVVDARVPLKKTGANHKARCPFHNEKSPSFTVSQPKQFYHCFGCGANGNAIGFLMEYDHMGFVEAVEALAADLGLEVPQDKTDNPQQQKPAETKELYEILEQANDFYQQQLREHSDKEQAVDYLKSRGLTGKIAKRFCIGYAPAGWENLRQHLKRYSAKQLATVGLLIEKDSGDGYDRFRHRIMFPIRDRRGRTIGFGGRVLSPDDEPKYLNSPETPVFHKRSELYGLYEALQAHRHLAQALVVEGYMDVVALAQFDIDYAVATLGTATTNEHIKHLLRQTQHIVFCFDGDNAGRSAAWKALQEVLPLMEDDANVQFMFVPDGEDPDSLVRAQGKEAFEKLIQQAPTLSKFLFDHISEGIDTQSVDGQTNLINKAKPLLLQVPGSVYRYKLLEQLSRLSHMDVTELSALTGIKIARQASAKPTAKVVQGNPPTLMQQAIAILLQNPGLGSKASSLSFWQHLELPGANVLCQLLELTKAQPHLTTGSVLEHWRGKNEEHLLKKLAGRELFLPDESLEVEFLAILQRLQQQTAEQMLNKLQQTASQQALNDEERKLYQQLLAERH